MKPDFLISINGEPSQMLNDRLLSITVTDQAGSVNDSATVSLDDRDEIIELPSKGDIMEVYLGYMTGSVPTPYDGLKLMGRFKLDEIKHTTGPSVLTLVGHAFDTGDIFKKQRSGQFHRKKVGEILQIIAERNGLEPRIHQDLGELTVLQHLNQRAQSDMSLVEHIASKLGAIAKVQDGKLYFAPLGKIEEVANSEILTPTVTVKRSDMDQPEFTDQSRSEYAFVEARYYDKDSGDTGKEQAAGEARFDVGMEISADYPTAEEASFMAASRAQRLQRSQKSYNFSVLGNPDLMAESRVIVEGQRAGIPDTWLVTQAMHEFVNGSGYSTKCACIVAQE